MMRRWATTPDVLPWSCWWPKRNTILETLEILGLFFAATKKLSPFPTIINLKIKPKKSEFKRLEVMWTTIGSMESSASPDHSVISNSNIFLIGHMPIRPWSACLKWLKFRGVTVINLFWWLVMEFGRNTRTTASLSSRRSLRCAIKGWTRSCSWKECLTIWLLRRLMRVLVEIIWVEY